MTRAESLVRLAAEPPVAVGQTYAVDLFRPEDAWGVARLYYAVYGPDYHVDTPYLPEALVAAHAAGDIVTSVARAPSGDILGQSALYRGSPPSPRLYESGQMLVLSGYRNGLMAEKLSAHQLALVPSIPGLDGLFGEAVTNHVVTQKMGRSWGTVEVGFAPGLLSAASYAREGASGRMGCLLYSRVVRDPGGRLHLPGDLADFLAFCLEPLGLSRHLVPAPAEALAAGAGECKQEWFEQAGVIRLHWLRTGADWEATVLAAEARSPAVVQVYCNLAEPCVGVVVRRLMDRGYFPCGVLPLWLGPDALLLQKVAAPPRFDDLALLTARGREMVERVRQGYLAAVGRI